MPVNPDFSLNSFSPVAFLNVPFPFSEMHSFLQRLAQMRYGVFVLAFILYALVFGMMPPPLEHYMTKYRLDEAHHPWKAISENINGTYRSESYDPHLHESKLTFRKVPALIGKLSPSKNRYVQVFFLYCVQLIMGLMFTSLLLYWLLDLTNDLGYSALLTLGFLLTHIGSAFTYDLSFFFDGMAFFFLGVAMFSTTPIPFVIGVMAALWTDERAMIGVVGVLLFKLISLGLLQSSRTVFLNMYSVLTVFCVATYLLVRGYMTYYLGLTVPVGDQADVGVSKWIGQVKEMPIAWLLTFKLYWYYLVPLVLYLLQRSVWVGVLSSLFILTSLLSTGLVIDIMRSATYMFPFLICGIFCSVKLYKVERERLVGRFNAIWNLVIPNYRAFELFYLIIPLPFRILKVFI